MITLPNDWATLTQKSCTVSARDKDLEICASVTDGPPSHRIVMVGDSHVGQYVTASQPIAHQRNWQLITMLRSACPFSTTSESMSGDQPCIDRNAAAVKEIVDLKPDAVFTLASRNVRI